MKIRQLFEEKADYFLPKSLTAAKQDLSGWAEDWVDDEKHAVSDDWKKKLPALAKDYLALVKNEIKPNVDDHTHEENVVDMREKQALKVFKKHKLIGKATKSPRDKYNVREIKYPRENMKRYYVVTGPGGGSVRNGKYEIVGRKTAAPKKAAQKHADRLNAK